MAQYEIDLHVETVIRLAVNVQIVSQGKLWLGKRVALFVTKHPQKALTEMNKHMTTKILVAILPSLVFLQDWAWMSGNKVLGISFLVFWILLIFNTWHVSNKHKVIATYFKATEIACFLLPIAALVLTFIVGAQAVSSTTNGAEQAGAAIGTAIGGVFAVGIGFVVGLFGGIIMHLLAKKFNKKAAEHTSTESQSPDTAKASWVSMHRTLVTVGVLIVLVIIAASSGGSKTASTDQKQADITPATSTTNNGQVQADPPTETQTKTTEPSPLEVTKTSVTEDTIGTPIANVTVKNASSKTVDAFKVTIKTFNNFGEPAKGFLTDNSYEGISQDEKVLPNATSDASWTLYNYDTTKKIEAEVYQVHFTDGSTWSK